MAGAYQVALTVAAETDLTRLDDFLRPHNPTAADRLNAAFDRAFVSLSDMPRTGRRVDVGGAREVRERIVRLGASADVMRYEIRDTLVIVARIHHAREDRP